MREITLDITSFEEKAALHGYLKEHLELSDYYGANLDALYDELTAATDPIDILLKYPASPRGKMVDYLPRLMIVFEDAARENYHLTVRFEEAE